MKNAHSFIVRVTCRLKDYFHFNSSASISELPGNSKTSEETIKNIPITNKKITTLTEREISFFIAHNISRMIPIINNRIL
jgi:hypothetical protein